MQDNIDFVDYDYGTVRTDESVSRNQIKTRQTSFKSILKRFNDFRLEALKKKLEEMKTDIVTSDFEMAPAEQFESKVLAKTKAIARVEEKILILSKENVPSNYVSNRAIKLKEKMMQNLQFNSNNAYSVGKENMDQVFENPVEESVPVEEASLQAAAVGETSDGIDLQKILEDNGQKLSEEVDAALSLGNAPEEALPREDIESVIESEMTASEEVSEETLPREDVEAVVDSEMDSITPEQTVDADTVMISPEDVMEAVNGTSGVSAEDHSLDVPVVSREEIEKAISAAIDAVPDEEVIEDAQTRSDEVEFDNVRITQNGSTEAKIAKFDADGNSLVNYRYTPMEEQLNHFNESTVGGPKVIEEGDPDFVYTPMTDEEIARAQENIELDKYDRMYELEWEAKKNQQEDTSKFVIPHSLYENLFSPVPFDSNNVDMKAPHVIDYTTDSEEAVRDEVVVAPERSVDVPQDEYVSVPSSEISSLEDLKAKVLRLQEARRHSEQEMQAAREAQIEEARIALEVRQATEKKKAAYADKIQELEEYCRSLEDASRINHNSAELARNDTACNRRFIEGKQAEMSDYENKMREIDSIISTDGNEEVHKGK